MKRKWTVIFLALSISANIYLAFKLLQSDSEIQSIIFSHTNYEYALDLCTQLLSASKMERTWVKKTMKEYYQKFSKAPDSLQDLISEGMLLTIPTDPVSKQEISDEVNTDTERGCRVEIKLCEGTTLFAYCK